MPLRFLIALLALTTVVAACSSDDDESAADSDAEDASTTTNDAPRPEGPVAVIEGPLTGGGGIFLGERGGPDLAAAGWVEEEYTAAGTAVAYTADDLPTDGTYALEEGETAEYVTRVIVRRPADVEDFSGTVVVEWLNVSGGVDAGSEWSNTYEELLRSGTAWVGVSAQLIGVEGGPVAVSVPVGEGIAGVGLKALDPERYGSLSHPGDAFSYDIYTQAARAIRAVDGTGLLGPLEPDAVLAIGQSQSAFQLTTYANGVQPLTHQFDGFLLHSRTNAAAPLGEPGVGIDIAVTIAGAPTTIRADLDVPMLILQTETEIEGFLNYVAARQPDTELLRVWEVAGTAHADARITGDTGEGLGCTTTINTGPLHFVAKAAMAGLVTWVQDGEAPPAGEPIAVGPDGAVVRDGDGNATGGVRISPVEVPVATLSGLPGPNSSIVCILSGSTVPFASERLAELYPTVDEYLAAFEASTDAAIEAGFVLAGDRDALLDEARTDGLAG